MTSKFPRNCPARKKRGNAEGKKRTEQEQGKIEKRTGRQSTKEERARRKRKGRETKGKEEEEEKTATGRGTGA